MGTKKRCRFISVNSFSLVLTHGSLSHESATRIFERMKTHNVHICILSSDEHRSHISHTHTLNT